MGSIFKAYDIRGRYGSELDEPLARKIGWALGNHLRGGHVVVGRDIRKSAPSISAAAIEGLVRAGCRVTDIGSCTTPMLYFAVSSRHAGGGLMVTASHNPPDDIGMKLCREDAIPIGQESGLLQIQAASEGTVMERAGGRVESLNVLPDYVRHLRHALKPGRPMKVAVDAAGGSVGPIFDPVFDGVLPVTFERLCMEPDPSFRRHEPDPLKDKNVADLAEAVRRSGAEVGIAFDGDGDRCIFLDRQGRRVSSDLISILLARDALERHPGSAIVYDLRSSRAVAEEIRAAGGTPVRERVGHAFIKLTMRKHRAAFGGELSGHFYFREHAYADSGLLACARMLSILGSDPRTLEERVAPYRRYFATGELNFEVADKQGAIRAIAETFRSQEQDSLDGITVSAPDWWFNVRASNTEPRLRLNLEASTEAQREELRERLLPLLGKPL